jgi:hypothetical protein
MTAFNKQLLWSLMNLVIIASTQHGAMRLYFKVHNYTVMEIVAKLR